MEIVQIVGVVGAAASVASFTPQAWKIVRARKTDGLSAGMYGLTVLSFSAWAVFGLLNKEWMMVIPNVICFLFALFIFGMILTPKQKTAEVAEAIDPSDRPAPEQTRS